METPDFTGLHGKELTTAHRKWRTAKIKAGASERKVRYAGLTREQAVEIYRYNNRIIGIGMLAAGILLSISSTSLCIYYADSYNQLPEPFSTFATIATLTWGAILIAWGLHQLLSIRTTQAAQKAYIHSEDERVQEAQRKSGLFPITIISFFEMQIGYLVSTFTASSNNPSAHIGLSSAGITTYAMGFLQILISLIIYYVLSKRN